LIICRTQFRSIQFKKDFCHGCGNAFVAIQKGVSLGQMVGIRRCTNGERGLFVVRPVFRSRQCRFQCPLITHTMHSTELRDGVRMNGEHFIFAEKEQGSLLYSAPWASRV
jgi:hypothetical protein